MTLKLLLDTVLMILNVPRQLVFTCASGFKLDVSRLENASNMPIPVFKAST